jgi:hypothetical protein
MPLGSIWSLTEQKVYKFLFNEPSRFVAVVGWQSFRALLNGNHLRIHGRHGERENRKDQQAFSYSTIALLERHYLDLLLVVTVAVLLFFALFS